MIKLMAVGDISLQTSNHNPFGAVKDTLKGADILIGNLETALSDNGYAAEKAVVLKSSPGKAKLLADAGFNILNIENNHTRDAGNEGYQDTIRALKSHSLRSIDSNTHYVIESIGFVSITERDWHDGYAMCKMLVAKEHSHFVVVSIHWGAENTYYPSPAQINQAHSLIDTGADIILGHHPHVLQGIELYKGKLIAYSLGNFQFDPVVSQTTDNNSMILEVNINLGRVVSYGIIPIKIKNNCPFPSKEDVAGFVRDISEPITSGKINWRFWYSKISKTYLTINLRSFKVRIAKSGPKALLALVKWLISPHTLRCVIVYLLRGVVK